MPPAPPPAQRSVEYWDGWYAGKAASPAVGEIMNRHLGLPPDLLAGVIPAEAIPEITTELRLTPGDTLADLACGRAGYGLTIAKSTGARLAGIDVSAEALSAAREQAARLGVPNARFSVGNLTATGLPDGCADAVLCTDSIQFPDEPPAAYREVRRVLKPGGRVALTCWECVDREDERLSPRLRRVDLAAGLLAAGFTEVEVRERPAWRERERRIWEEAVTLDPEAGPGLRSFRDEAVSSMGRIDQLRRVLAVATAP
jgi:SAM-dependent methyltransferase